MGEVSSPGKQLDLALIASHQMVRVLWPFDGKVKFCICTCFCLSINSSRHNSETSQLHSFLKTFFIYLAVPGLSCGLWDLVLWPGIKPMPPALGARNLSHWKPRKSPGFTLFILFFIIFIYLWLCCTGFSLVVANRSCYSVVAVLGPLIAVVSFALKHGPFSWCGAWA